MSRANVSSLTASVEHLRQGRLVEGQPVRLVGDPRVDACMHRLPEKGCETESRSRVSITSSLEMQDKDALVIGICNPGSALPARKQCCPGACLRVHQRGVGVTCGEYIATA